MKTKTDFSRMSVANGLRRQEFDNLPAATKKKLVRLIARISEASFRRGLQHGNTDDKNPLKLRKRLDIAKWRASSSLDVSQSAHGRMKHTSLARLGMEYGVLRDLGLM